MVYFGDFGNYGTAFYAEVDEENVALSIEYHAYGDLCGSHKIFTLTPAKLRELSENLMFMARQLEEKEKKANA